MSGDSTLELTITIGNNSMSINVAVPKLSKLMLIIH